MLMLKKLFTNDKFFLAMALFAVVSEVYLILMGFIMDYSIELLPVLLRVACIIVLYVSYIKHSKNVMKGMIGALLLSIVNTAISLLSYNEIVLDKVCSVIFLVVSLLLFINHFIINSNRHSSPKAVLLNQLVLIIMAVNNFVWTLGRTSVYVTGLGIATMIIDSLCLIAILSVIVCVESRLDAYRLDREAAGWTEEAGYPEGYVHQKDR